MSSQSQGKAAGCVASAILSRPSADLVDRLSSAMAKQNPMFGEIFDPRERADMARVAIAALGTEIALAEYEAVHATIRAGLIGGPDQTIAALAAARDMLRDSARPMAQPAPEFLAFADERN